MKDKFEATFTVDVAPDTAWSRIARRDLVEHEKTREKDPTAGQVWLPGWDTTAEILESVPGKLLRVRKDMQPCEGTEIVVKLEARGTGTKITVVQSGFGAMFDIAANWLGLGWDHILRDIMLCVERGAIAHRHMSAWGRAAGFNIREVPSGLVVLDVTPDTAAAKAGLAQGDHLLSINRGPVSTIRDLSLVMRALPDGCAVRYEWARESKIMSGTAQL